MKERSHSSFWHLRYYLLTASVLCVQLIADRHVIQLYKEEGVSIMVNILFPSHRAFITELIRFGYLVPVDIFFPSIGKLPCGLFSPPCLFYAPGIVSDGDILAIDGLIEKSEDS